MWGLSLKQAMVLWQENDREPFNAYMCIYQSLCKCIESFDWMIEIKGDNIGLENRGDKDIFFS